MRNRHFVMYWREQTSITRMSRHVPWRQGFLVKYHDKISPAKRRGVFFVSDRMPEISQGNLSDHWTGVCSRITLDWHRTRSLDSSVGGCGFVGGCVGMCKLAAIFNVPWFILDRIGYWTLVSPKERKEGRKKYSKVVKRIASYGNT